MRLGKWRKRILNPLCFRAFYFGWVFKNSIDVFLRGFLLGSFAFFLAFFLLSVAPARCLAEEGASGLARAVELARPSLRRASAPPPLVALSALSEAQRLYYQDLVERAFALGLARHRYWRILLHYRRAFWGGYKSETDDPWFFNSAEGGSNPEEELRATLLSFFAPLMGREEEKPKENAEHPQCRFIDRYEWLKEKLRFDPQLLPEQRCYGFEEWRNRLNPQSATLVFASYYLHNPASVMGHTFLRLNRSTDRTRSKLLDYGVNYAAVEGTGNVLFTSLAGLVGALPGEFSNSPYYLKVEEYGHLESRDLWEYELSLSRGAIDRVMRHLWALGHVRFPYYFIDKNCSFMLLTLLEAADPSLSLSGELPGWAIPADTLRIVLEVPGLVKDVVYRPSLATQIARKREGLGPEQDEILLDLVQGDGEERAEASARLQEVSDQDAAVILDTALEYLQLRRIEWKKEKGGKRKYEEGDPEEKAIRARLLSLRAKVDHPGLQNFLNAKSEAKLRPDHGHRTFRATLGAGLDSSAKSFFEAGLRLAFHDFNAMRTGYPRNSLIEVGDFRFRFYPRGNRLKLESARLLNIAALTPVDQLFVRRSWAMSLGVETVRDIPCGECNQFRFRLGTGYAIDLLADQLTAYALGGAELGASSAFIPDFRLGPAADLGLIWNFSERFSAVARAQATFPLLGHRGSFLESAAEARYSPDVNQEIRLGLEYYETGAALVARWGSYF